MAKFSEAESLLRESLIIEEAKSSSTNIKIGRRLVELSINLAAQGNWEEGSTSLEKVLPVSDLYSGHEKEYIIYVLNKFGEHFNKEGDLQKGGYFISKANEL